MPKISELDAIALSGISPGTDELAIVDTSESQTKRATISDVVASAISSSVALSGDAVVDGDLTHDFELHDIATLTLDATSLNLAGVTNVSLASTGAGVGQGEVEIRADQQFRILTPAVVAQTATEGQTLQLVDAINGIVEFGDQDQDSTIIGWAASGAYAITSATRDSDGVITTASVSWPDSSTGTFTRATKNATFLTIDAYTVTHTDSGKTAIQSAVTRDSSGNVTAQPAITIL